MTKRPNPLDRYARDLAPGALTSIGVRPRRRASLLSVHTTQEVATHVVARDHRMGQPTGRGRPVALIAGALIAQPGHC